MDTTAMSMQVRTGHPTVARKLVAVMFADIEGYTALFQRNEAAAIRQVEDHRKDLAEITGINHGEIMQFYGDGSLTIYDSIVDAIHSAVEIQRISALHRIPVRIGIHFGDIVLKNGDLYGDSVNIASRIQALGAPGSVLVSQKVADELHNHPELRTVALGTFPLKNVKGRMRLYALAGEGLIIPEIQSVERSLRLDTKAITWLVAIALVVAGAWTVRGWMLKRSGDTQFGNELFIIPPFRSFKVNGHDETGESAASYITHALNETTEANIMRFQSIAQYTRADLASVNRDPRIARRYGARMSINGSFMYSGPARDSLVFWASIEDLEDHARAPIPIKSVACLVSNEMKCFDELVYNLRGYWKTRDTHLFRTTNIKAYNAYMRAVKSWADPKRMDQAKEDLLEAIRHDPKFIDAYFLLLDGLNNKGEYASEADTINLIRILFDDLSPREENLLRYYQADLDGRNKEAFGYLLNEIEHSPNDLMWVTAGMVMALEYLNDPLTTIRLFGQLYTDSLDLNVCTYCHTSLFMAMKAYLDLSDIKNALQLAKRLQPYAEKTGQFVRLMDLYMQLGDSAQVNTLISRAVATGSYDDDNAYYHYLAARLATINGRYALQQHYVRKALEIKAPYTSDAIRAGCYLLTGDYIKAKEIYLSEIRKRPQARHLYASLGVVYAKEGDHQAAESMIEMLETLKPPYDYGRTAYYQGRIKANMGLTEEALRLLQKAIDAGEKFEVAPTFLQDPDMVVLNTDKRYIELLGKNRVRR